MLLSSVRIMMLALIGRRIYNFSSACERTHAYENILIYIVAAVCVVTAVRYVGKRFKNWFERRFLKPEPPRKLSSQPHFSVFV